MADRLQSGDGDLTSTTGRCNRHHPVVVAQSLEVAHHRCLPVDFARSAAVDVAEPRSDCCLGKGTDGPQDRGSPRLWQSWLRNGFVPRGVAARGGANTSATGPRHTTPVHGGKRVAVATFATQTRRGESPGGQEAAQSRGLPGLEVGLDGSVSWLSGDRSVGSPRLWQSWLRNGFVPRGVAVRGGANTSATGPRFMMGRQRQQ